MVAELVVKEAGKNSNGMSSKVMSNNFPTDRTMGGTSLVPASIDLCPVEAASLPSELGVVSTKRMEALSLAALSSRGKSRTP